MGTSSRSGGEKWNVSMRHVGEDKVGDKGVIVSEAAV